jgi:membrane protease YdiL (CAAX protease family)
MEFVSIALFALTALAIHIVAYFRDYFRFPYPTPPSAKALVSGTIVLCAFVIYWLCALLAQPIGVKTFKILQTIHPEMTTLPLSALYAIQVCVMVVILVLLLLLTSKSLIWKQQKQTSRTFDFSLGMMSWLLSFPLVSALGEFSDWFLTHFFGPQTYQQTAVRFLKNAAQTKSSIVLAFVAILFLAPLVEELLFRGILQNYLKSKLGVKAAILLSAFTFSLFHFSPAQGLGNVTLLLSLLVLGLYLGFLYERQHSLFASIGLHMTFNTISTFRILFSLDSA